MAKKKAASLLPKLTEAEEDLLSRMQEGYKLETDSLGGNPTLRRLKDNEVIHPLSVNRNTIKALEQRGFISPAKGRELALYCVASEKETALNLTNFLSYNRKQCSSGTFISSPCLLLQRLVAFGEQDSSSARSHWARCPSPLWSCSVSSSRALDCSLSSSLSVLASPGQNGAGFSLHRCSECRSNILSSSKDSPSRRFRTLL